MSSNPKLHIFMIACPHLRLASGPHQTTCLTTFVAEFFTANMKLDTRALRYLNNDDWRVLAAVCTKHLSGLQIFSD